MTDTTTTPTPKSVARDIHTFTNSFSTDKVEELARELANDHRTLQQSLMRGLVWPLLKSWAEDYESGHYDLRNEATVKLAHDIVTSQPEVHFPWV